MLHRSLASFRSLGTAIAVIGLGALPAAQAPAKAGAPASAVREIWSPPRTADGHPDLQGRWTNATYTPLERPARFAGKEFLTEEEVAAFEKQRLDEENSQPAGDVHYDNVIWLRESLPKVLSNRRSSLVTDPPDGKIPALTPEARQRAAVRAEARKTQSQSDVEARTLAEQCVIWPHVGPPMLPAGYNANLEIVQGPGYVGVLQEMIHDLRIIPLAGRPHLPSSMRQWMGDSQGRWEGDTLVVDTTNFTDRTNFRGSTGALHVVERFTRVTADAIRYEFTVDDPATWLRPWSAEITLRRAADRIFEYACHEGNHDLTFLLRDAREAEAAADAAKKTSGR